MVRFIYQSNIGGKYKIMYISRLLEQILIYLNVLYYDER